jgi:hypothetical protein
LSLRTLVKTGSSSTTSTRFFIPSGPAEAIRSD